MKKVYLILLWIWLAFSAMAQQSSVFQGTYNSGQHIIYYSSLITDTVNPTVVSQNAKVALRAATSIRLLPGFRAGGFTPGNGGYFLASIGLGGSRKDTAICKGQQIQLGDSAELNVSYAWSPSIGLNDTTVSNPLANPDSTTMYLVLKTFPNGRVEIDTMVVVVNPLPVVNASRDTTIYYGDTIQIGSTPDSLLTYLWHPPAWLSDSSIANPIFVLDTIEDSVFTQIYTLLVTDTNGCTKLDSVAISVLNQINPLFDPSNPNSLNPNYYKIIAKYDPIFETMEEEEDEDGEKARYRRWKYFWEPRNTVGGIENKGDMNKANDMMKAAFLGSGENICREDNSSIEQNWEPIGPFQMNTASHGLIPTICVKKGDPNTVYVGSRSSGIFKTTNALSTTPPPQWTCLTDNDQYGLPSLGCRSIAAAYDDNMEDMVIIAATGPYMSSWTNNYSIGIIYSIDDGVSWDLSDFNVDDLYGAQESKSISKVIMYGDNPAISFAISSSHIYYSSNWGQDYERLNFTNGGNFNLGNIDYGFSDIEFDSDPEHPSRVWFCGNKLLKYFDFPANSAPQNEVIAALNGNGNVNLALNMIDATTPANSITQTDEVVKMQICHNGDATNGYAINVLTSENQNNVWHDGIWRSTNNGTTFTQMSYYNTKTFTGAVFDVSPNGQTIYMEASGSNPCSSDWGRNVFKSLDGGANFFCDNWQYGPGIANTHADIRALKVVSYSEDGLNDQVFVGHDGGISYCASSPFTTSSGGTTSTTPWRDITGNGMNNSEFFNISVLEDTKEDCFFGAQDNAYLLFENGIWGTQGGSDGYEYKRNQNNFTINSLHETNSYSPYSPISSSCSPPVAESAFYIGARMAVDAENNIYTGFQNVFRFDFDVNTVSNNCERLSDFRGDFFSTVTGPNITSGNNAVIHVNKYDPNYIYVAKKEPTWNQDYRQNQVQDADGNWNHPACSSGQCGYRKLYRTSNALALDINTISWSDIGQNTLTDYSVTNNNLNGLPGTAWGSIFDIETDPNTAGHVWISFTNISDNPGKNRVYYSPDHGATWKDYSTGLPRFPVSRLVYQEGSNDLLYAATDVGVYYRNASMDSWECFSNDLPVCTVSDLEIDYCERKLYASTFGRGAWKVDLIDDFAETVISTNTTWTDKRQIGTVVRVLPGVTLTVTGVVRMPKDGKIIVEPTAKLIVDGGTLTNACDEVWEGVEVWGDPTKSQNTASYQGLVKLMNGALIENAKVGIYAGIKTDCCSKNGGLILASDATFRNNRKDVAFMPYPVGVSYTYNSYSRFTDCIFETTAPMNDHEAYIDSYDRLLGTSCHVTICGQNGVKFTDCIFSTTDDFDKDIRPSGIGSVGSRYSVNSTDPDNGHRSQFINLRFGISSMMDIGSISGLTVKGSMFDNCQYGIRSESGVTDFISGNTFKVQDDPEHGDPITNQGKYNTRYGIYEIKSLSYKITENIFITKSGSTTNGIKTYGAVTEGYPTHFGWGILGNINHNTFNNMRISTQLEHNQLYTQVLCNSYNASPYDWVVNPLGHSWAALAQQGSGCSPEIDYRAENNFDNNVNNIYNRSINQWKYYSSGLSGYLPTFVNDATYNSIGSSIGFSSTGCNFTDLDPSCDESTGGGGGDPQDIGELKSRKADLAPVIQQYRMEHDSLLAIADGGQTDNLLAHIANASYSKPTLVNELLSASLLSDTVLLATTARSAPLNQTQYKEVIIANTPLTDKVWKVVAPIAETFKSDCRDSIFAAQQKDSIRTRQSVLFDLNITETQWHQTVGDIIRFYSAADTTDEMHNTLFSFIKDTLTAKPFRKLAIGYGIQIGRVSEARTMLDSLELSNAHDTSFYNYYDLAISLAEDTLSWFGMDSLQKEKIWDIAKTSFSEAYLAQAVLSLIEDSVYIRTPEPMPEDSGSYRLEEQLAQEHIEQQQNAKQVSVFPNPFSNSFTIAYNLGKDMADLKVEVFDIVGQSVHNQILHNVQSGSINIDLGQCLGIYIVRISKGAKQIYNGKMICISK